MGGHDQLEQRVFAALHQGLQIVVQHSLERLRVLPFRMARRERPDPVHGVGELEVIGLLGPERAVVVEDGDTVGRCDEVRSAGGRGRLDEMDDGGAACRVLPVRQRARGFRSGGTGGAERHGSDHSCPKSVTHSHVLLPLPGTDVDRPRTPVSPGRCPRQRRPDYT